MKIYWPYSTTKYKGKFVRPCAHKKGSHYQPTKLLTLNAMENIAFIGKHSRFLYGGLRWNLEAEVDGQQPQDLLND